MDDLHGSSRSIPRRTHSRLIQLVSKCPSTAPYLLGVACALTWLTLAPAEAQNEFGANDIPANNANNAQGNAGAENNAANNAQGNASANAQGQGEDIGQGNNAGQGGDINNLGNQAGGNLPENSNAPANNAPLNNAGNTAPANAEPLLEPPPINNAAPTNAAPTNNAAAAPVAAPAQQGNAASGPQELNFRFDQRGMPGPHAFKLKWPSSEANLAQIEVLNADTGELVQTIAIPQDGKVRLIYKDIAAARPGRTKDKFFDFVDYNFDSYGDIKLTRQWTYQLGEKFYLVWIFDTLQNKYILHDEISALPQAIPNAKERRIETVAFGSIAGGEYEKRWYSLTKSGRLKVQTVVRQTARDRSRLVFNREVRHRINGEMQRICKLVVPTEGTIQLLWGTRDRCDYHMKKHDL